MSSMDQFAEELEDPEMVRTPVDKHKSYPRESLSRGSTAPPRPPMLWGRHQVIHDPKPCFGRYPRGFLSWALQDLGIAGSKVLHVCTGGMTSDEALGGIRLDLRSDAAPDVLADGRRLPFMDGTWPAVLIDPPYSVEYAQTLYGVEYPRPSHLLREAARVVRPGGLVGFLHYLIPVPPPECAIVSITGVSTGLGYRIRAWTVYRKEQASLF